MRGLESLRNTSTRFHSRLKISLDARAIARPGVFFELGRVLVTPERNALGAHFSFREWRGGSRPGKSPAENQKPKNDHESCQTDYRGGRITSPVRHSLVCHRRSHNICSLSRRGVVVAKRGLDRRNFHCAISGDVGYELVLGHVDEFAARRNRDEHNDIRPLQPS